MKKILWSLMVLGIIGFSANFAYSQEMGLATYQETAQVIFDRTISNNVTASITLQSSSIQEIKIPAELEQKVRENPRITAVILTNQNQCVVGVNEESCIMINVSRNPDDKGVLAIQNSTKEIAQSYIDEINQAFDTEAEFHSIFIHSDDTSNTAYDTSGIVSGRGAISAVYTMPMEDTDSMYEKVSAILLPKIIRESGGFYDAAKNLSSHNNSKMTFSLIPLESKSLMQLKVSRDYPNTADTITKIDPLKFLGVDELHRSQYFSGGFYPLNSIVQVLVLSPEDIKVSNVNGNVLPTQIIDNEKIPTDISKEGWVFDPLEGERVQGKYIFGKTESVKKDTLMFTFGDEQLKVETESEFDESTIVVGIIAIAAIGAALFYLKGYKR